MSALIDTAIARALALPCFTAPNGARALGGGITNVNILLEDQGRRYVVRLGEDIPEHGVMRFNELAVSRAAHAAGVAPAVVHAAPGVLVLDHVDAAPLTEPEVRDPANLPAILTLVRRLHTEGMAQLRGPVLAFWVFHILRDYAATLAARGSSHAPLLPELMVEAAALETMVGPVQIVLGHNDLLCGNILRGADRLWLIDWDYARLNTPLFDLAGLASNNGFDRATEHWMLEQYFGRAPDADLWRSYGAMKCASLLRETMWSMVSEITSALDFDYATYTRSNLDRYRAALGALQSL